MKTPREVEELALHLFQTMTGLVPEAAKRAWKEGLGREDRWQAAGHRAFYRRMARAALVYLGKGVSM